MFWGAFCGGFRRTGLIPLFGDSQSERGGINRSIMRQALDEVEIEPPISPDLNPIKNLWTLLKQKIYELRPELIHMRNNDETKELLVATAQEAWNLLDWKHLENLSATMPHRVEAIIESQGWYTQY
ncbi:hypothetical protein N7524_011868 [Penicillium chrysogenum]|nr:hypothetical protein N7524_011868 [Penicillium chrysogenum]